MSNRRKLFGVAAALIGVLLAALLILPALFKGRIAARARAELERAVNARVDRSGIGLTFWRNFPNLTLGLQDLTVVGIDRFAGDTLAAVGSFRLVLDAGGVVRSLLSGSPIVVRSIRLDEPRLSLDGPSQWRATVGSAQVGVSSR